MSLNTDSLKTQVVIIGAGPTGLSLAAQFIRQRIDFIILDKNAGTTTLSKALVVHARTLEIFKELGIADKALSMGERIKHLNAIHNGEMHTQLDIFSLGEGLSEFPFVLSLEQSKTEKLLYDYLQQHNKNVWWECSFKNLEQKEDGVRIVYTDAAGKEYTIDAAYLVGCDGAHSPVRHQLGLSFEGDTETKLFYVADVQVSSPVIKEKEFYFITGKESMVLFFGIAGDSHYRVIGVIPPYLQNNASIEFNDIVAYIKEQAQCELSFTELKWFSTYKVSSRKANAFFSGRSFICGDAAHIHTPAGGQGMNTGIQDAYNLAWKLAMALKQQVNPQLLVTYSNERTENAARLLRTTDRIFDLMAGRNLFLDFLRQYIFSLVGKLATTKLAKRKIFPILSQIGIAYPNSALTVKSSAGPVKAGDRMTYFEMDGKSIFDFLTEPVFKILSFGNSKIQKDFAVNRKVPYECHAFDTIPDMLEQQKDVYILLRPDNHISWIGHDIKQCYEFLDSL